MTDAIAVAAALSRQLPAERRAVAQQLLSALSPQPVSAPSPSLQNGAEPLEVWGLLQQWSGAHMLNALHVRPDSRLQVPKTVAVHCCQHQSGRKGMFRRPLSDRKCLHCNSCISSQLQHCRCSLCVRGSLSVPRPLMLRQVARIWRGPREVTRRPRRHGMRPRGRGPPWSAPTPWPPAVPPTGCTSRPGAGEMIDPLRACGLALPNAPTNHSMPWRIRKWTAFAQVPQRL